MTPAERPLRILGWNHPRCLRPLRAAAEAWTARAPGPVEILVRSGPDFAGQPVTDAAARCDLLLVDHPWIPAAADAEVLVALDDLLPAAQLTRLVDDAVDAPHAPYRWRDRQWALAADAACQMLAVRADDPLAAHPPRTWDEVAAIAAARPGAVGLPLTAHSLMCTFLAIAAAADERPATVDGPVDRDAARTALRALSAVARHADPACFEVGDPELLEALLAPGPPALAPSVFGYTDVTRPAPTTRLVLAAPPSLRPGGVPASMLGGVGLAVTAAAHHPPTAAAFAAWYCDPAVQATLVVEAGGQPGSRTAWRDPAANAATGAFFETTAPVLAQAAVRPRAAWWPRLQHDGGELLRSHLRSGSDDHDATLRRLDELRAGPGRAAARVPARQVAARAGLEVAGEPARGVGRARVGVVGVGDFGVRHARGLAALDGAVLVGVADRDAARAHAVAAALGVPAYPDVHTLLADARPDAVVVATPEAAHVEVAVTALEAGAAVLLEKPVSVDLEGAVTLQQAVARTGGVLVPAHVLRFAPPYRRLCEAVRGGALGEVLAVVARRDRSRILSARYPTEHPARLTAVHDIDLALWITRSTPVQVRALARGRSGAAGPVLVQAQVETADGGVWAIGTSYTHPDDGGGVVSDRFEVHGSSATLAVDSAGRGGDGVIDVDVAALLPEDGGGALRAELAHFCRCVADSRPSDVVTLDEAVVGLACVEAIVRSAADGGRVVEVEVPR